MTAPLLNLLVIALLKMPLSVPAAENQKGKKVQKTVIITNRDTSVNGKRLAEMSKTEREKVRKELQERSRIKAGLYRKDSL